MRHNAHYRTVRLLSRGGEPSCSVVSDKAGYPNQSSHNSRIVVEPVRIDEHTGKRFTFFADPDELPLELYEQ